MNGYELHASSTKFRSPWWLPEGHTQTLWRRFTPQAKAQQRRQRIELADGDFIDVDWVDADKSLANRGRPIVMLLHGLSGCSQSSYILSLQRLLQIRGYTSVAMNFRGCSGEMNRKARAYHSGCTEDVDEVFRALRAEFPEHSFAFAGFSLGANVLLKWLSEIGDEPGVLGAVAVSTPFSLVSCAQALTFGGGRIYGEYFRRRLVSDLERKRRYFRQNMRNDGWQQELERLDALGDLSRLRTLWDFDDQITAPLHGFEGADDYYARCSSGPNLHAIVKPVRLIQSANDPIIPVATLPSAAQLAAKTQMQLTKEGGHVGFICVGSPLWLEEQVFESLSQMSAQAQVID